MRDSSGPRGRELVLETVTGAVNGEHVTDVEQAIEDGRRDHLIAEQFAPAIKGDVAGQERRLGVLQGDQLEEQVGAARVHRETPAHR